MVQGKKDPEEWSDHQNNDFLMKDLMDDYHSHLWVFHGNLHNLKEICLLIWSWKVFLPLDSMGIGAHQKWPLMQERQYLSIT